MQSLMYLTFGGDIKLDTFEIQQECSSWFHSNITATASSSMDNFNLDGVNSGTGNLNHNSTPTDGYSGYFPFDHEGGGNLNKDLVMKWFKDICECPATKIFHNASYDVG